jgi:hypothetical protein
MYGYGRVSALGGGATVLGIASGQSWVILVAAAAILIPALVTRAFWRRRKGAFDA